MNLILKNCLNYLHEHSEMISVLLASSGSISLWWLEVEFAIKLLISILTCIYISIKIYKSLK